MASQKQRNKDLRQELRDKDELIGKLKLQLNQRKLEMERLKETHSRNMDLIGEWAVKIKEAFSKDFVWKTLGGQHDVDKLDTLEDGLKSIRILSGKWKGKPEDKRKAKSPFMY